MHVNISVYKYSGLRLELGAFALKYKASLTGLYPVGQKTLWLSSNSCNPAMGARQELDKKW